MADCPPVVRHESHWSYIPSNRVKHKTIRPSKALIALLAAQGIHLDAVIKL